jgi:hypothetical protein
LILDCDTFYTQNIIDTFRNSNENVVFYVKNKNEEPIYSYISSFKDNHKVFIEGGKSIFRNEMQENDDFIIQDIKENYIFPTNSLRSFS